MCKLDTEKTKEQISSKLYFEGVKEHLGQELYNALWRAYGMIETSKEAFQVLKMVEYNTRHFSGLDNQ